MLLKFSYNNIVNPSPMLPHITGDSFIIILIMTECAVGLDETSVTSLIPRGDLNDQTGEAGCLSLFLLPCVYNLSKFPLLKADGHL